VSVETNVYVALAKRNFDPGLKKGGSAVCLFVSQKPETFSGAITMSKGHAIRFVKGTYLGKEGWINAEKKGTAKKYYVIIDLGNGETKEALVNKDSVKELDTKPAASYSEATLREHPDIEAMLDKVCRELAKCSIENDGTGIMEIIQRTLTQAVRKQELLGHKAVYRRVKFDLKKQS
jgi:hypothetical protein